MKIKIIQSFAMAGLSALRRGDKLNVPDAQAQEWIALGCAIEAEKTDQVPTKVSRRERAVRKAPEVR